MVAEGAGIIERGLCVPVPALAVHLLAMAYGCVLAVDFVGESAVGLLYWIICGGRPRTPLGHAEGRVVGALNLEIQAFGDEIKFLSQGKVHLQFVLGFRLVTAAVVDDMHQSRGTHERKARTVGIIGSRHDELVIDKAGTRERSRMEDVHKDGGRITDGRPLRMTDDSGDI